MFKTFHNVKESEEDGGPVTHGLLCSALALLTVAPLALRSIVLHFLWWVALIHQNINGEAKRYTPRKQIVFSS